MKIKLITEQQLENLTRMKRKLQPEEIDRILEVIGRYMVASVRQNFDQGGRPHGWKPLKPSTIKRKKGPGILMESGNLQQGIVYDIQPGENVISIGPSGQSLAYAMRHNNGDIWNWPIPRRRYLIIQEEDKEYIEAFTTAYIY